MINAPRVPTVGSIGYQMYQTTGTGGDVPSKYDPIIVPNNFADLFFEKAVIEVLGGTEIEPSTQMHQTTKIIQVYTTVKPEELYTNTKIWVGMKKSMTPRLQLNDIKYQ